MAKPAYTTCQLAGHTHLCKVEDRMMLVYFLGKEAQDIEQAKIIPTKWQVSGFEHKRFLRLGISVFACL